jgi:hypothetical protein
MPPNLWGVWVNKVDMNIKLVLGREKDQAEQSK